MTKKTAEKKAESKASNSTKNARKDSKPMTKRSSGTPETEKESGAAAAKVKSSKTKHAPAISRRERIIQEIKQDLLTQRESLLREAEETLSSLPSELNFPDMGDQATAEADRNFILRLRDRERMLLKKIEETIERIENGPYGICDECGNEIGIKRLEARPVTTLCIECKTRQEEEERLSEGG